MASAGCTSTTRRRPRCERRLRNPSPPDLVNLISLLGFCGFAVAAAAFLLRHCGNALRARISGSRRRNWGCSARNHRQPSQRPHGACSSPEASHRRSCAMLRPVPASRFIRCHKNRGASSIWPRRAKFQVWCSKDKCDLSKCCNLFLNYFLNHGNIQYPDPLGLAWASPRYACRTSKNSRFSALEPVRASPGRATTG